MKFTMKVDVVERVDNEMLVTMVDVRNRYPRAASTAMDLTLEEFVAHPFKVGDVYTVELTPT